MQIETERLYIRQLTNEDFDLMSLVWAGLWFPLNLQEKFAFARDDLLQKFWEEAQSPEVLTGLIFLRDGDVFCGRVNMQQMDQAIPEVGIDLLQDYRNQGYGPEAITGFVNWFGENYHISDIKVRISARNTHSVHMFEKLGARAVREIGMFSDVLQDIRENLPEDKANSVEDIVIREYSLKLPIAQSK